ncbi:MAG TPA: hypothetical protein VLZ76_06080 [Lysobacter sp.]|nr:hypothetical protein [Lysobacter sp.]
MKLKYSASLALVAWLCVAAWVIAMIVAKPSVAGRYAEDDDSGAIAQLQVSINHNQTMLTALDALSNTTGPAFAGTVIAPAPTELPGSSNGTASNGAVDAGNAGNRVSLIISTDRGRRAVVDGLMVRVGTRLADGSRVHGIGHDWVRLEDAGGEQWTLQLPPPFSNASKGEL